MLSRSGKLWEGSLMFSKWNLFASQKRTVIIQTVHPLISGRWTARENDIGLRSLQSKKRIGEKCLSTKSSILPI